MEKCADTKKPPISQRPCFVLWIEKKTFLRVFLLDLKFQVFLDP